MALAKWGITGIRTMLLEPLLFNHPFFMVNQGTKWPCSIAMLVYQRVNGSWLPGGSSHGSWLWVSSPH